MFLAYSFWSLSVHLSKDAFIVAFFAMKMNLKKRFELLSIRRLNGSFSGQINKNNLCIVHLWGKINFESILIREASDSE